jgi:hypothetical protein
MGAPLEICNRLRHLRTMFLYLDARPRLGIVFIISVCINLNVYWVGPIGTNLAKVVIQLKLIHFYRPLATVDIMRTMSIIALLIMVQPLSRFGILYVLSSYGFENKLSTNMLSTVANYSSIKAFHLLNLRIRSTFSLPVWSALLISSSMTPRHFRQFGFSEVHSALRVCCFFPFYWCLLTEADSAALTLNKLKAKLFFFRSFQLYWLLLILISSSQSFRMCIGSDW